MHEREGQPRGGSPAGPGVVVLHWSPAAEGLVEELARAMVGLGVARITCVRDEQGEPRGPEERSLHGITVTTRGLAMTPGSEAYVAALRELDIAAARSVIVLPQAEADDPDSGSRLTCAAIRRACGDRLGPNVLVEIEDPEAAFEFVGLGVATVFYPGHLRAALLGQACVDLGVFQFVVGLLCGRHRIRSVPIPEALRGRSFAEAALELEQDERGRPLTIIGLARRHDELGQPVDVVVNPGPRAPLRDAVALLALVTGDREQVPA